MKDGKKLLECAKRAVKGCGVSFYRFPTDLYRRSRWIAAINGSQQSSPPAIS